MGYLKRERIYRFQGKVLEVKSDWLAREEKIEFWYGEEKLDHLVCSPVNFKELILGWMLFQGYISLKSSLPDCRLEPRNNRVYLKQKPEAIKLEKPASKITLTSEIIFKLARRFEARGKIYQRSGAVHSAGVFEQKGQLLAYAQDISRRTALVRVLGKIYLSGINPKAKIFFLSGRVFEDMVGAVLRTGAGALLSLGAPSKQAKEKAEARGLVLIGFIKKERFNIYAGEDRVKI